MIKAVACPGRGHGPLFASVGRGRFNCLAARSLILVAGLFPTTTIAFSFNMIENQIAWPVGLPSRLPTRQYQPSLVITKTINLNLAKYGHKGVSLIMHGSHPQPRLVIRRKSEVPAKLALAACRTAKERSKRELFPPTRRGPPLQREQMASAG
jgi:hypothetical protein